VHCRAGIGRTGTTIALVNSLITMKHQLAQGVAKADLLVSPFSIVRRLREQRIWMVQVPNQYWFIHEFLKYYYMNK